MVTPSRKSKLNRSLVYWLAQALGWALLGLGLFFIAYAGKSFNMNTIKIIVLAPILGVILSHTYRFVLIRMGWTRLSVGPLVWRVLLSSMVLGMVYYMLLIFLVKVVLGLQLNEQGGALALEQVPIWSAVFLVWSLIYFAFHFFENYRKEEIKNLRIEAGAREVELNSLKAQLNPHFMFNAMNSIRALVDDDPRLAKNSITQLSNILRNTLLMGKKRFVLLDAEMNMIRDYLQLEGVRYEERLQVEYELEEESLRCFVPPLMLQTLAENAIKHGISTLAKGGVVRISTRMDGQYLWMRVENTGQLTWSGRPGTGTGLSNTVKRLELLFGKEARFEIYNQADRVISEVRIPKQLTYEGHHH